ncbi:hypothetical protein [Dokdonella sp.]|uniref:hypothetical protein n=1 Tax=Dokdonella sp. TaxID=2291710 RepID=UPI003C361116
MRRPGFWREVGVALALSVAGGLAWSALSWFLSPASAMRWVIATLGVVYAVLQLRALDTRAGRMLVIGSWLALNIALFAFNPPLSSWVLAQAAAIWMLRCWACHGSFFTAIADGVLGLFAATAGVVVIQSTHSIFLALWSFFLIQALVVFIPDSLRIAPRNVTPDNEDRFARAQRSAEAALHRLANRH